MKNIENLNFNLLNDISFVSETEDIDLEDFVKITGISKNTVYEIRKNNNISREVHEKFYSFAYKRGYRFNLVKEQILKEINKIVLFHGSKDGMNEIKCDGSRLNCDFGSGFYLGENYKNALSFVSDFENSCVYSFLFSSENLEVLEFRCDLEWMLAICYFRGQLKEYENSEILKNILKKISKADLIIAPIADNRMFYIMSLFTNGEINVDVAINCLHASNLGKQYVIKTEKALKNLIPVEKNYVPGIEKEDSKKELFDRAMVIDNQLNEAKRKFRNGRFIEEIFDEKV